MSLRDYDQLKRYFEIKSTGYLESKLAICKEIKLDIDHEIDMIGPILQKRRKVRQDSGEYTVHSDIVGRCSYG